MSWLSPADWEVCPTASGAARVFSPSNIAIAKYWGKRDVERNLPTNGSISITLKDFGSFTTVEFLEGLKSDELVLNGQPEPREKIGKVARVLDEVRKLVAGSDRKFARVQSRNNFPTAAGLASSASGLSAVALAAAQASGLDLPLSKISEIARLGSGSACRSLHGGFVRWNRGEKEDGTDSIAESIEGARHWDLAIRVAVAREAAKAHASTSAMELTRLTSPYFEAWTKSAEADLDPLQDAIRRKDFPFVAQTAESNCLRMHASAMAARPPVHYWRPQTVAVMEAVWDLRARGVPAFFTIDAGPNVVCVCERSSANDVDAALSGIAGVHVLRTDVGEGARRWA